jgi:hypothetical protein
LIKELRDFYNDKEFCDKNGVCNLTPSPVYITELLINNGLRTDNSQQRIKDVEILPRDYFCPKDIDTFEINITDNTLSIHHFNSTWHTDKMKKQKKRTILIRKIFGRTIGGMIIQLIVFLGAVKHNIFERVGCYGVKNR